MTEDGMGLSWSAPDNVGRRPGSSSGPGRAEDLTPIIEDDEDRGIQTPERDIPTVTGREAIKVVQRTRALLVPPREIPTLPEEIIDNKDS